MDNQLNIEQVDFNPFSKSIEKIIPSIPPQKEIWMACKIGGREGNLSYNQSISLHCKGKVDIKALEWAIDALLDGHEVLRSSFSPDGENLIIYQDPEERYTFIDLSANDPEETEQLVREFYSRNANQEFDLLEGPLVRFYLIHKSPFDYILNVTAHHIVCDGWSLGVIMEELGENYSLIVNGHQPKVNVEADFGNYAHRLLAFEKTPEYALTNSYWVERFKGHSQDLELPIDFPRTPTRTYKGRRRDFMLPQQLVEGINRMVKDTGCSVVNILMSCLEITLSNLSGNKNVVIGLPTAGQVREGDFTLIGHCVNLLPIKSHFFPKLSFLDYLRNRKEELLMDLDHQDFTFSKLLEVVHHARDFSRVPLVPFVFNIDLGMEKNVHFKGLEHKLFTDPREFENFEIFLNMSGGDSELTLEWSYNSRLFLPGTIERLNRSFEKVIWQAIENPAVMIGQIRISEAPSEESMVRVPIRRYYPSEKSFASLFSSTAVQFPSNIAASFKQQTLTYKALDLASNQWANYLINKGVIVGDVVGLAVDRSMDMLVAILGILKSGATYLPLDPSFPGDRLVYMLDDAQTKFLIINEDYRGRIFAAAEELILENVSNLISGYSAEKPSATVTGNDLAYILYTSGSTGKPKGVQVTQRNLINLLWSIKEDLGISPNDKWLAVSTISFDIACNELFLPLLVGACVVIADVETVKDARLLIEAVKKDGITFMQATPPTWRMILTQVWDFKETLKIISTGEALPKDLAEKLLPRSKELWNGYGPTETTVWSSLKKVTSEDETITIGTPIANTAFYILDGEGNPVVDNQVGELYIGGDGVSMGYLNKPELTAERFLEDPFWGVKGVNMYRTGDLARILPNGETQCLGRADNQIKIRGYRVELEEIAYQLQKLDGIVEAVVVVCEESAEDQRLVAYFKPATGFSLNFPLSEKLPMWREQLKSKLPGYMIPTEWMCLETFPLTPNNKIDRKALPNPILRHVTSESDLLTPQEQLIADSWVTVLGNKSIGRQSNFFDLGGHSLTAIKVIAQLEKKLERNIPIVTLFRYPIFSDFVDFLIGEQVHPEDYPTQVESPSTHSLELPEMQELELPATEPQTEIFVACALGGEDANRAYNLSFSLDLTGDLNYTAMNGAMKYLVRHESLRATFSADGTKMLIHSQVNLPYEYLDVSGLALSERKQKLDQLLKESVQKPFDLIEGPLCKFSLLKTGRDKHLFTIMIHHIICDGWSIDNLFKDLGYAYSSLTAGKLLAFGATSLYSEYAVKKKAFYESGEYAEIGEFWKEKFSVEIPVLELPLDFERPLRRDFSSKRIDLLVPLKDFPHLSLLGKKVGGNTASIMRVMLEVLLHKLTHQTTLITGMPVAGHLENPNYELMVGHCVNMLPVKTEISGKETFDQYFQRRKVDIITDFEHQSYTFGSILKNLSISRDASRLPLVSFVMNFERTEDIGNLFSGMTAEVISNPRECENFEIVLNISEESNGMLFRWAFQTALFAEESIRSWHQNFLEIIEEVAANPAITIDHITIQKSEKPSSSFLTGQIVPVDKSFLERLKETAAHNLDKPALSYPKGVLTYAELEKRSNQLARMLKSRGIQADDRVGVYLERSMEQMIAILGILKVGASYVPLDITYPGDRIQQIVDNAGLNLIISKTNRNWDFPEKNVLCSEGMLSLAQAFDATDLELPTLSENRISYILHTSGSTGKPKGVCMGQQALSNLIQWQLRHSKADDSWKTIQFSPITFDVSFQEIFATWCSGGCLVLISEEERLDSAKLLEVIVRERVNRLFQPFVALQALCEIATNQNQFPSELREVITAGEQLNVTPQVRIFFKHLNQGVLINQYGPTETHVVTEQVLGGDPENWPALPGIGFPIHNTKIWILDNDLHPVHIGQIGELCVSGLPLAEEYLRAEELNQEKFVQIGSEKVGFTRIYRTGDLAKESKDGSLEFLGRKDTQVKIRGFRVELGEIEALMNNVEGVKQAVVTVQKNAIGQNELVANIQFSSTKHESSHFNRGVLPISGVEEAPSVPFEKEELASIKMHLIGKLPDYMIPRHFINLTEFPKTPSGKIDRKALTESGEILYSLEKVEAYFPPKTSTERVVGEIWSKLLRQSQISVKSNFFEIGGYSLIGLKVMAEIEKHIGVRLPLIHLFENPSIEKLAGLLEGPKDKIKWDSLVTIKAEGNKPPIYIVHGGGLNVLPFYNLLGKMDPNQPIYGIQARGLNGLDNPFESIQEMAAYYLTEILQQNPYGPYQLAGYSFGGVIAFEMAQQLRRLNKEVKKLILFDTYANQQEKLLSGFGKIWSAVRNEIGKRVIEANLLINHTKIFKKKKVNSYKDKKRKVFSLLNLEKEIPTTGLLATQERIISVNKAAVNRYIMEKYPGEVYLFRAKIWDFYDPDLQSLGWKPLVGAFKKVDVEGNHVALFEAPNVSDLAVKLQQALDQ